MSTERPTPFVGMPATIHYVTDTSAAVIVKVNPKSVIVRRVELIESTLRRVNDPREALPIVVTDGDVSKPIGQPNRYPLQANGSYRDGSIGLELGKSYRLIDYRD